MEADRVQALCVFATTIYLQLHRQVLSYFFTEEAKRKQIDLEVEGWLYTSLVDTIEDWVQGSIQNDPYLIQKAVTKLLELALMRERDIVEEYRHRVTREFREWVRHAVRLQGLVQEEREEWLRAQHIAFDEHLQQDPLAHFNGQESLIREQTQSLVDFLEKHRPKMQGFMTTRSFVHAQRKGTSFPQNTGKEEEALITRSRQAPAMGLPNVILTDLEQEVISLLESPLTRLDTIFHAYVSLTPEEKQLLFPPNRDHFHTLLHRLLVQALQAAGDYRAKSILGVNA
jgi:hypothetical protein